MKWSRFGMLFGLCTVLILVAPQVRQAVAQKPYEPVQTTPADLATIAEGTVSEIVKSDLIRLDSGALFVLDNIRAPVVYNDNALAWLDKNLLNKPVSIRANLHLDEGAKDRMGNRTGHVIIKDEKSTWVQEALVAEGLVWADATPTNRDLFLPLLRAETAARDAGKGFWAAPGMMPRKADAVGTDRDTFMVVEGKVLNTADKKSTFFVNFGDDWKTDFTLFLKRDNSKKFPRAFDLAPLVDQTIRVRGWVSERNGPSMELTYPEQIEIVDNTPAAPSTP